MSETLLSCLFVFLQFVFNTQSEIVNINVTSTINIETHLVKNNIDVFVQNLKSETVDEIVYFLDPSVINYYVNFKNDLGTDLQFKASQTKNRTKFAVFLDKILLQNETYKITVEFVCIDQIRLVNKLRRKRENQILLYTGNLYFYSCYKTLFLKITYELKVAKQLKLSHKPHQRIGNKLIYSYRNIELLSFKPITIEYMNNEPKWIVSYLERSIDVSHYGIITIEDKVSIRNEASELLSPFVYKLMDFNDLAHKWWYTHLPAAAHNVKYFDILGNSSKSVLLHFDDHKTFKFKPRYPLINGWKTSYIIKYDVPIYEYLYRSDFEGFVLKTRAIDHILDDVVVRRAVVKILLPEAGRILRVEVPQGFRRSTNVLSFNSLSIFGRPTVVLKGSNLIENHIAGVTIEYLFPLNNMFRVPLLLVVYVESLFLLSIFVIHIN